MQRGAVLADIFISYARADRDKIEKLAAALEAEGYSVWWDRQIEGGAKFSAEIEREVLAAKTVIVAWSASSIESMWVADEATIGRDNHKLVPIAIDAVTPPIGFRQVQTLDFERWNGRADDEAFSALVQSCKTDQSGATPKQPAETPARSGVSLIVLPFRTISADPRDQVLTIAIHEDLTTQLARVKDYFVIARTTAARYEDRDIAPDRLARELGVTYVLEGSVRRGGDDIRVSAQLIDARSGGHLAALSFDRPAADLLGLQNDLIAEIINHLGSEINLAEVRRLEERAGVNPSAVDSYKCARVAIAQHGWNRRGIAAAIDHLEKAIEADPDYAPAISHMALLKGFGASVGIYGDGLESVKADVTALADRAIKIDRQSSDVLGFSGCALCDIGDVEHGLIHLERAAELDPSNAQAHAAYGWARIMQGKASEGVARMSAAIRISPQQPGLAFWMFGLSEGLKQLGDDDGAAATLERAIRCDPSFAPSYLSLAAIYNQRGDQDQAKKLLVRANKVQAQNE